jgi:hypothetical protein
MVILLGGGPGAQRREPTRILVRNRQAAIPAELTTLVWS